MPSSSEDIVTPRPIVERADQSNGESLAEAQSGGSPVTEKPSPGKKTKEDAHDEATGHLVIDLTRSENDELPASCGVPSAQFDSNVAKGPRKPPPSSDESKVPPNEPEADLYAEPGNSEERAEIARRAREALNALYCSPPEPQAPFDNGKDRASDAQHMADQKLSLTRLESKSSEVGSSAPAGDRPILEAIPDSDDERKHEDRPDRISTATLRAPPDPGHQFSFTDAQLALFLNSKKHHDLANVMDHAARTLPDEYTRLLASECQEAGEGIERMFSFFRKLLELFEHGEALKKASRSKR